MFRSFWEFNVRMRRIFFVILIFSAFFAAAEEPTDRCRRFFFELWRYEYSGVSELPDIGRAAGVSKSPAQMAARITWTRHKGVLRLADALFPEYAGVWDASLRYDAAADSGAWIDSLGLSAASFTLAVFPADADTPKTDRTDEPPPESSDILSLLEKAPPPNDAPPPKASGENGELNALSILPAEKQISGGEWNFTDSNRALRLHVRNDEAFAVQKTESGRTAVRADNKRAVRSRYDDSMRLIARETWDFSKGADAAFIAKSERYDYGDGTKLRSAVILEDSARTETTYDAEGRAVRTDFFQPEKDKTPADATPPADGAAAPKKEALLQNTTRFIYNAEGKIAEKQQEKYHYKDGALLANETENIRDVFEYKTPDAEPNHFYYENGILRMKTIYTGVDTYIASMYFDGGYSSEIHYEEGQRTKDLFFLNGTLLRSKTHE